MTDVKRNSLSFDTVFTFEITVVKVELRGMWCANVVCVPAFLIAFHHVPEEIHGLVILKLLNYVINILIILIYVNYMKFSHQSRLLIFKLHF